MRWNLCILEVLNACFFIYKHEKKIREPKNTWHWPFNLNAFWCHRKMIRNYLRSGALEIILPIDTLSVPKSVLLLRYLKKVWSLSPLYREGWIHHESNEINVIFNDIFNIYKRFQCKREYNTYTSTLVESIHK